MSKLADLLHRYEAYVNVVLRLGLGIVFFWFGVDKFIHPKFWIGFIPQFIKPFIPVSLGLFNNIQGVVEAVVGLLLIIGLWRQLAAAIAGIILIPIIIATFVLGVPDIALRDIGLLSIAIVLTIIPETILSVDSLIKKRKRLRS